MKGLEGLKDKLDELIKEGVPIWSISKMDKFKTCPQSFKFTYVEKLPKELFAQNIYAYFGTAIHEGQEDIYNSKEDLSNKECRSILDEKFEKAKEFIGDWNSKYEEDKKKSYDQRDHLYPIRFKDDNIERNFITSVQNYIDNFTKCDKKRLNETFILIEIAGHWYRGYIDVIQADDKEKKTLHIIDYKTSSEFGKEDRIAKGRQMLLYAYAIEKLTGYKVTRLSWDMIKYLNVKFKGKTRKRKTLYLRSTWVSNFVSEMRDALLQEGVSGFEVGDMVAKAIEDNEIPEKIKHYFDLSKGYVDYPITDENMAEMLEYIKSVPEKVAKETKFKPITITDRNCFFCQQLCDSRLFCEELQKFKGRHENESYIDEYRIGSGTTYEELF